MISKLNCSVTLCFLMMLFSQTILVCKCESTCLGIADFMVNQVFSKFRMTTIHDGNYTIQVLLGLTEDNTDTKCSVVSREGLIKTFAIKYALNKFNANPEFANMATLGLQIEDSCKELPVTMARGIEVIYFHRNNSVCRADFLKCSSNRNLKKVNIQKATALIGTGMSFTAIPLASLMSLYSIPQISPSASSRLLSNKKLYKSFFRTIPSDSNQVLVMLDIFEKFEWNYVFAVGSDDDYGKLGVSELKQEAIRRQICIIRDEYIPFKSNRRESRIKDVILKIKNQPKAKVVVLFSYLVGLGDLILKEAEKEGVRRMWLTSEAWNPQAVTALGKDKTLRNQTHGLLTVSLEHPRIPNLLTWMERHIRDNYQCDFWLQRYILDKYSCEIENITKNSFLCKDNKTLNLKSLLTDLKKFPGNINRLIDSAMSLGYAIHNVVKESCKTMNGACLIRDLSTEKVTKEMFKTNFTNDLGETVSYNSDGDPMFAYYTIENLVYNETSGSLQYVQVGDWDQGRGINHSLVINNTKIQWPYWFNVSNKGSDEQSNFPVSKCSKRCHPSEYVVGKTLCCWACQKCQGNNYTDKEMAAHCLSCGNYSHTIDHIHCLKTPIQWIRINNNAGKSIVVISVMGLLGTIATSVFLFMHWKLVTVHDKSPQLLVFVCVLQLLTFVFGPMHIIEPTQHFCQIRNSYFFVLFILHSGYVLVKTQSIVDYLKHYSEKLLKGNMIACQFLVLFCFVLLEIASMIVWLYIDGQQVQEIRESGVFIIQRQCKVDFTAARLVSAFIPCIILIIATFCAFRERNDDHSFYEPKFLSFSCIALCIIIVAFLPTFKYVVGIHKAIVLAFTINVFGYTFMACLILPKVYVGLMRKRRGIQEYPMKAGTARKESEETEKKKKEKEQKQKKAKEGSTNNTKIPVRHTGSTNSDIVDCGNLHSPTTVREITIYDDDIMKTKDGDVLNCGYYNKCYEKSEESADEHCYEDLDSNVIHNFPPPNYETSITNKNLNTELTTKC